MKMKSHITFTMAGVLLALSASAQEGPIRIQPAPLPGLPVRGIEVEPAKPLPDFAPGEEFPVPPEMPPDAWGEPGFGGEMIMPAMPYYLTCFVIDAKTKRYLMGEKDGKRGLCKVLTGGNPPNKVNLILRDLR